VPEFEKSIFSCGQNRRYRFSSIHYGSKFHLRDGITVGRFSE
jgi:hypothetical protein